ncbi:hypothetical protein [Oceanidesulfovibrio marinus]|uniref:Uncharacterized protein n=1 Tax=Oceanidesulfovibrio marinus TaxID=370038 RepID=A0A6P1ZFM5_9BACT|nr:hypothetical protein [Oceanidesulfovibrio marinus]TVM31210.1 hypothetical protein DQK91_19055 [Oceanidesulfovibrio marinus]
MNYDELIQALERELLKAKIKHPVFADDMRHAMNLITEELGEAAMALNDGDVPASKDELMHVIVTCARAILEL